VKVCDLPDRLGKRIAVDEATGCWRWLAGTAGKGYAYAHWDGGMAYVHRITYHLLVDNTLPIRGGGHSSCIDHVADVCAHRDCVNPEHLELVPWAENVRRWYRDHPETNIDGAATKRAARHLSVVPPIEADPTPAHGLDRPVVAS
jgi:hypothetical protein